jgi:hypothetical protein
VSGLEIFGTGDNEAAFQCFGTVEEDNDKLNMSAIGAAKNGALIFKNLAERSSRLVAVGRNASSILNTYPFKAEFRDALSICCALVSWSFVLIIS